MGASSTASTFTCRATTKPSFSIYSGVAEKRERRRTPAPLGCCESLEADQYLRTSGAGASGGGGAKVSPIIQRRPIRKSFEASVVLVEMVLGVQLNPVP